MDRRGGRDDVQLLIGDSLWPLSQTQNSLPFGIDHRDPPIVLLVDGADDDAKRAEALKPGNCFVDRPGLEARWGGADTRDCARSAKYRRRDVAAA